MAKRNYKTLKGLIGQCLFNQIKFNDFHVGQFYHKTAGWQSFTLPESEKEKAYMMFSAAVFSDQNKKMHLIKNYSGPAYRILDGLILRCKRASYVAGQDYPREIRVVQGIFRNNG